MIIVTAAEMDFTFEEHEKFGKGDVDEDYLRLLHPDKLTENLNHDCDPEISINDCDDHSPAVEQILIDLETQAV